MTLISKQPYIEITRTVESNEQQQIESRHHLCLYRDKIITESREFPLHNVLDISFKIISGETGFLYLHTNHQVFSFYLRNHPHEFIEAFRKLK
ncbi:hypothetical protein [Ammoniphilus sp. YIM 78166]|uniref:hypothetical protein n=1 Tax=Ammoniphilus sp. YIM 78166 TaxID=1644106 RepID=UPI0010706688|nr:hypothetical protein [Ammoniphilus sp. YIM 78166]